MIVPSFLTGAKLLHLSTHPKHVPSVLHRTYFHRAGVLYQIRQVYHRQDCYRPQLLHHKDHHSLHGHNISSFCYHPDGHQNLDSGGRNIDSHRLFYIYIVRHSHSHRYDHHFNHW